MFRKRERSALENSLIDEGVAVRSDVGSALLNKLFELGYSDHEVCLNCAKEIPYVIVAREKITDIWLISIRIRKNECREDGTWKAELWWPFDPYDEDCDMGSMDVYSKYDICGKLISDV